MKNKFKNTSFVFIAFLFVFSEVKAQKEYLVTVDPSNGVITKIDSIPDLMWLLTTSAYNQVTKKCTIVGRWEMQQSHLFTIDAISGNIISNPILSSTAILNFQYSRLSGVLYGIVVSGGVGYLATIDPTTSSYTLIHDIPGLDGITGDFAIDEANQHMFIPGGNGLLTIDLTTGNILSNTSLTRGISDPRFDNVSNKLYGITYQLGPTPGSSSIFSLCTIDPLTGNVDIVASLPDITGYFSGGHTTFNENEGVYFFIGDYQGSSETFLYSVDVNNGNVISRVAVPSSGAVDHDNLIFFRYDNISSKLYALFWEAHTVIPPIISPVTPSIVDSSCSMDFQTKVYPGLSSHTLIVDKKPTKCKVTMNLYNMLGQLIIKNKEIFDGLNEIQFFNFSFGIYTYKFISENRVLLSGRFLKE